MKIANENFIHFSIIHDNYQELLHDDHLHIFDISNNELNASILSIQQYIQENYRVSRYLTLLVLSPLGYGATIAKPNNALFATESINFADLLLLLESNEHTLESLLIMVEQRERSAKKGHEIFESNSLLNLYACWKNRDYSFSYLTIPYDAHSFGVTSCGEVKSFRQQQYILKDKHLKQTLSNDMVEVRRLTSDSIFNSEKALPIYVSVELYPQSFSACFDIGITTIWIIFNPSQSDDEYLKTIHDLWMGVTRIVFDCLSKQGDISGIECLEIEVLFNFQGIGNIDINIRNDNYAPHLRISDKRAKIEVNNDILPLFYGTKNIGELILIKQIVCAIYKMGKQNFSNHDSTVPQFFQKLHLTD